MARVKDNETKGGSMRLALLAVAALMVTASAIAAPTGSVDALARDVARAASIRDVKTLQRSYAQYAQYGLWNEMAALFAQNGIVESGLEPVQVQAKGRTAIAAFLTKQYGNGHQGLETGAVHTILTAAPVVNLSIDGTTAKARWDSLSLLADSRGNASAEGGIFENEYVKERGVWKIATLHFYPQYAGPYETGWTNVDGKDLPIIPYLTTAILLVCPFRRQRAPRPRPRPHWPSWKSVSAS